ncbi:hypothetical protein H257_17647 [Aphanomyces astaci]|uniref:Uncharacterized protein n=1 Tax=Aphanomyces astaci TaxID=112090 RepID=W4FE01_APHAT|nr:hypothetical protein H257_17647 [Aphanomyces astaci]ETV65705.1 hypothetical protein H257_17647 [Aphanomyces astaci]|eukprot:XP_009844812.1 hypothetical protein H257_17647 [Aphanomyces astaci]
MAATQRHHDEWFDANFIDHRRRGSFGHSTSVADTFRAVHDTFEHENKVAREERDPNFNDNVASNADNVASNADNFDGMDYQTADDDGLSSDNITAYISVLTNSRNYFSLVPGYLYLLPSASNNFKQLKFGGKAVHVFWILHTFADMTTCELYYCTTCRATRRYMSTRMVFAQAATFESRNDFELQCGDSTECIHCLKQCSTGSPNTLRIRYWFAHGHGVDIPYLFLQSSNRHEDWESDYHVT